MAPSAKTLRAQLMLLKPIVNNLSLGLIRKGQNKLGELMARAQKKQVVVKNHAFECFEGVWMIPCDTRREGVILYLHGGGYACGGIEYAGGFSSVLAVSCGARVFAPAYRLAPEHKFPAAVDDALEAYEYLLKKGYQPEKICLCGESAGGGLCYSLCLKLRELGRPMPCGIIAISPWTDLSASGKSYKINKDNDPSMSIELLDFYASCYTDERKNPLVSPLFADLSGMPPSLIFAGGDEIMLDDSVELDKKLPASKLYIKKERWHGYLLYGLKEDLDDMETVGRFLDRVMAPADKLRWMRLDNAAKIYPAARRQNWSNVFRVSASLKEAVDHDILQSALDITARRFPSMAVRLRRGVFWYYLEQLNRAPRVRDESPCPLTRMSKEETSECAIRVICYKNRIAVEVFHSLSDGTGAMIFLKTLVAEYISQRYGVTLPTGDGVLGRLDDPDERELEDCFLKHAGPVNASRKETTAWHLSGTPETPGFLNLTCFDIDVNEILSRSREKNVSLTVYVCACLMMALQNMQKEKVANVARRKPIKVLLPVNLRPIFDEKTLRNFAMYSIPEIDPRLGEYDFDEICSAVKHRMGLDINAKHMGKMIATNVSTERVPLLRLTPLFLKNIVMRAVFDTVGERKSCLSLSNLGRITLPEGMDDYIERFDFILGPQAAAPHNCGVLSYGDRLYINFIRNVKEPELEYHFFKVLRELGIEVRVQSNAREGGKR